MTDRSDSQFREKKLDAQCKEVLGLRQDLLPGRYCTMSYQCRSSFCKEGQCSGLKEGNNCYSHADCMAGTYCRVPSEWPFKTTCEMQLEEGEVCTSDEQCLNTHYCWYASKEDKIRGVRSCM
mmetsp:Transcript_11776/g.19869  ORF Transcript_11776/g.19869 Transcript_11776/m.19869 type:complete len:122 (+) Transcript_11776:329-694(+)